jgi:predicted O-methyltransferase YrrM
MTKSRTQQISDYIRSTFVKEEDLFLAIKRHAQQEALPNIAVPENVGKLLYLFTKLQKPKRILEIGTLAGYSTMWFASAAPDATITTIECNQKYANVARDNFKRSDLGNKIELIVENALKVLERYIQDGEPPFDLIFLDADKEGYPHYLPLMLALSRPGTLLLTDNLIPKHGEIKIPPPHDNIAASTYRYNELLTSHPKLETILVPTIVGEEGRIDALGISLVTP